MFIYSMVHLLIYTLFLERESVLGSGGFLKMNAEEVSTVFIHSMLFTAEP